MHTADNNGPGQRKWGKTEDSWTQNYKDNLQFTKGECRTYSYVIIIFLIQVIKGHLLEYLR